MKRRSQAADARQVSAPARRLSNSSALLGRRTQGERTAAAQTCQDRRQFGDTHGAQHLTRRPSEDSGAGADLDWRTATIGRISSGMAVALVPERGDPTASHRRQYCGASRTRMV
jgi:hypothetical protein